MKSVFGFICPNTLFIGISYESTASKRFGRLSRLNPHRGIYLVLRCLCKQEYRSFILLTVSRYIRTITVVFFPGSYPADMNTAPELSPSYSSESLKPSNTLILASPSILYFVVFQGLSRYTLEHTNH